MNDDDDDREQSPDVPGPRPIRRLEQALVNRIAAGEIIHRPSSALKELLENSLDAGSTAIRVTIKDGGLKLLQIQDDGSGIRKEDLPILCERSTTSKLTQYSDLQSIATYGFRGEALASISFVSHLTVTTKTREDACAWKVAYADGRPVPFKAGQSADAKPCAGNDGTLLVVEDLFYNTPTRLSALRSSSDEYARILDVVSRYATHNPHVAFSCKKVGSSTPDIMTPGSTSTIPSLVRILYGSSISSELVHVPMSSKRSRADEDEEMEDDGEEMEEDGEGVEWKGEAYVTSVNYHVKKMGFLLFINHRSVESSRIKRAIESIYTALLPKGGSPWVYLSLNIDPASVDVNVHPTKKEVHFIDEEKITSDVVGKIQAALVRGNQSRTFEYQTLLTGPKASQAAPKDRVTTKLRAQVEEDEAAESEDGESDEEEGDSTRADGQRFLPSSSRTRAHLTQTQLSTPPTNSKPKSIAPQHKVRGATQHDRTLDSMFLLPHSSSSFAPASSSQPQPQSSSSSGKRKRDDEGEGKEVIEIDSDDEDPEELKAKWKAMKGNGKGKGKEQSQTQMRQPLAPSKISQSECYLQSVLELREEVEKRRHAGLSEILGDVTFIGIVDLNKQISLLQHSTKLYITDHSVLAEELFYQLGLRQFGDFGRLHLDPAPDIRTLIKLAVQAEDEDQFRAAGLSVDAVVNRIANLLVEQREMLQEYFGLNITEDGMLESLPILLNNYTPNLDRLPLLLMRLGPQVNWTEEKACFESILRELAYFYIPAPIPSSSSSPNSPPDADEDTLDEDESALQRWQIQHVLIPAFRLYLAPPKSFIQTKAIVQVASLPELYKVFERC